MMTTTKKKKKWNEVASLIEKKEQKTSFVSEYVPTTKQHVRYHRVFHLRVKLCVCLFCVVY